MVVEYCDMRPEHMVAVLACPIQYPYYGNSKKLREDNLVGIIAKSLWDKW